MSEKTLPAAVGSSAELGPTAWLVTWQGGEHQYVQAFASELSAVEKARIMGGTCEPMFALTAEEVQAVNKLRARREWMKRDLTRCNCDRNEYCQHCWPESFRPGGVWHGLGA